MSHSSILPEGKHAFLPIMPTNGQVYIDANREQWIFNADIDYWEKIGTVDELPKADNTTIGLFSAFDKLVLDRTPAIGGGFGLIVDPKLTVISPENPEGAITGDIKLLSESLDILCVGSDLTKLECAQPPELECASGGTAGLLFKLSDLFLKTLIVDHPGPQGKKGDKGLTGDDGDAGFSDGPRGVKGKPGVNIDELCVLTGVDYNDIDGITDTAIVNMQLLDTDHGCKLVVTKSKLNIPNNSPADKIIVSALGRSIIYDDDPDPETCDITRLTEWKLVQAQGDTTPLNMQLLRLANGPNEQSGPIGFNGSVSLQDLITETVDEYMKRLTDVDVQWGNQVKKYIQSIDDKARTILSELANQVTMCEFNLPATEFCITLTPCDSSGSQSGGSNGDNGTEGNNGTEGTG